MSLTPDRELYLEHAGRILGDIDDPAQMLGSAKVTPKGLLRMNATLGSGPSHVAPVAATEARHGRRTVVVHEVIR